MVQYETTVSWDSSLRDVCFADADTPVLGGLAISGLKITTGAPSAVAGHWLPGAVVQNIFDGTVYQNNGTTASPSWYII